MKNFKLLLILMFGLGLQACETEIPLLEKMESINPNEGMIIFNLYTTDENVREGIMIPSLTDKKNIYINSTWLTNDENTFVFNESNHLSARKIKQKYVVAKVAPGSYHLSLYSGSYSYKEYGLLVEILSKQPVNPTFVNFESIKYTFNTTPLTFKVNPGEIKYLGDIELVRLKTGCNQSIPFFIIHNHFEDAKLFLKHHYPNLLDHLSESIISKTETQLFNEQKYSSSDNSILLKEINHAK